MAFFASILASISRILLRRLFLSSSVGSRSLLASSTVRSYYFSSSQVTLARSISRIPLPQQIYYPSRLLVLTILQLSTSQISILTIRIVFYILRIGLYTKYLYQVLQIYSLSVQLTSNQYYVRRQRYVLVIAVISTRPKSI